MSLKRWLVSITKRACLRDERGAVLIEFVVILPIFLIGLLLGGDLAYYIFVRQQVAYIARTTADNASRIGEDSTKSVKQVSEADILDVLTGGSHQTPSLNFIKYGKIRLSSLEQNSAGGQWIHWQRCIGDLPHPSSYGEQGAGITGTAFPGMGKTTLKASADGAIMFVEAAYDYTPLFGYFWTAQKKIVEFASFRIRERRDLTMLINPEGVTAAACT